MSPPAHEKSRKRTRPLGVFIDAACRSCTHEPTGVSKLTHNVTDVKLLGVFVGSEKLISTVEAEATKLKAPQPAAKDPLR